MVLPTSIANTISLPDPTFRHPATPAALLPVFACYYLHAILVLLPQTSALRFALLPVTLWQAWYVAVHYDLAKGIAGFLGVSSHERIVCWNYAYVIAMCVIVLRATEWTFVKGTLKRYRTPEDVGKDPKYPPSIHDILLDAVDLVFNQRGQSWSWSRHPFPSDSRELQSIPWLFSSLVFKSIMFDAIHYAVQYSCPSLDRPEGDTVFDASLPPAMRYLKAIYLTISSAIIVYTAVDLLYLTAVIPARLLFRQDASRWPPLSNRPWLSTSLADFWGRRWHQFFRHIFIATGSRPLYPLFGRPGAVLGSFFVSAVIHDWGLWGLGRGTEFLHVGGFFVLMGVGLIMEEIWAKVLGRKVGGIWGWAWTMTWTVGWATMMVDAWARRGLVGSDFMPPGYRPGKPLVDALVNIVRGWVFMQVL